MGTGKSTVGHLVAAALGFSFVDTDSLIEKRHGPIVEIFASAGEPRFRSLERDLAAELAQSSQRVIATGGRLMLDPVNHDALAKTGRIFCLSASIDAILDRIGSDTTVRPLLKGDDPESQVRALLAERAEAYARFEQVDTDNQTPSEVAATIVAALASPSP